MLCIQRCTWAICASRPRIAYWDTGCNSTAIDVRAGNRQARDSSTHPPLLPVLRGAHQHQPRDELPARRRGWRCPIVSLHATVRTGRSSIPDHKHNRSVCHTWVEPLARSKKQLEMRNPPDLPAGHVVAALSKLHHGSTIETSPPALRFSEIKDLLKLIIRGTILVWMFQRLTQCMCNFTTCRASGILIGDEPRRDEGRAGVVCTVDPFDGRALDTFGAERCQLLIA